MSYPLFDLYGRNNFQMPQQMPQMFNPGQMYQQSSSQFITRQVSNIEEAKACMIDPLSTYLFIDVSVGKIYMKRMNNNGLSDFYTFVVEENKQEIKKEDPLEIINKRLENIENKLGGMVNVQSVSDDGSKSNECGSESNVSTDAKTKP